MTPTRLLLATATVLLLAACNQAPPPAEPVAPVTPAATDTQAIYGDEAPVAVPAEPAEPHGHSHDGDADHAHDDDHSHDDEPRNEHEHDHGDGNGAAHEH